MISFMLLKKSSFIEKPVYFSLNGVTFVGWAAELIFPIKKLPNLLCRCQTEIALLLVLEFSLFFVFFLMLLHTDPIPSFFFSSCVSEAEKESPGLYRTSWTLLTVNYHLFCFIMISSRVLRWLQSCHKDRDLLVWPSGLLWHLVGSLTRLQHKCQVWYVQSCGGGGGAGAGYIWIEWDRCSPVETLRRDVVRVSASMCIAGLMFTLWYIIHAAKALFSLPLKLVLH